MLTLSDFFLITNNVFACNCPFVCSKTEYTIQSTSMSGHSHDNT